MGEGRKEKRIFYYSIHGNSIMIKLKIYNLLGWINNARGIGFMSWCGWCWIGWWCLFHGLQFWKGWIYLQANPLHDITIIIELIWLCYNENLNWIILSWNSSPKSKFDCIFLTIKKNSFTGNAKMDFSKIFWLIAFQRFRRKKRIFISKEKKFLWYNA